MCPARTVLTFDRDEILHRCSPAAVQSSLQKHALELAILGSVDQARTLIEILYQSNWTTDVSTSMMHGLCYAWDLTGQCPGGIVKDPEEEGKDDVSAHSVMREYIEDNNDLYERLGWDDIERESRTFDERGLKACMKIIELYSKGAEAASDYEVLKRSQMLVKALDISLRVLPPWIRIDQAEDATTGAQIQTIEELDPRSHDLLIQIIDRWEVRRQMSELGIAEKIWPLCISGVVRDAVGMSQEQVMAVGQQLIDVFSQRFKMSAFRPDLPPQAMRRVLERAELNTLCGSGNEYWLPYGVEGRPTSYFRPGASEAEIARIEKGLYTQLPNDYKEFLCLTNGFGAQEFGIFNGYYMDPELWSVDKIQWSTEEYFQLPVDLLGELPREYYDLVTPKVSESVPHGRPCWNFKSPPIFDKVLQIGTLDISNLWLVYPALVKQVVVFYNQMYDNANSEQKKELLSRIEKLAGSKNEFDSWSNGRHWCCVMWDGEMTAYASFRSYLDQAADESAVAKV